MENKTINIQAVAQIANALQELCGRMVFVGGATISLYTDDPAADEIRPTTDIDLTIQLTGYSDWTKLQERLLQLGFSPDPEGNAMCNYLYQGISLDIMPAENSSIGNSNRWYQPGFGNLWEVSAENQTIKILSAPYFLATKFEAFKDRGNGDYRTGHDFEDIIYLIDNRTTMVEEVLASDDAVRTFLAEEFSAVLANPFVEEIIQAQIHPLILNQRYPMVMEKIKTIVASR